ncbi:IS200/IS605 family transposase ISPa83 [Achromobacter anxifer]|uniref:RNA-guided endonuclease InsQ/TnpB family protein n=1 Tax=Achromobacter anxifer TaxID=1287737 RepID=UPI00155B6ACE|nr:transposase [Achromobacter anxifer]CAB5514298.1 IS200/IS605 family transposase ISPa83 [Achromobacter anxifer]
MMAPEVSTRVLRVRLKDRHATALRAMAREVNFVWNYCNDLGMQVLRREGRFMSGFDFQKYLNGASKEGLGIGSAVFQQVAEEFATRRRQFKKARLAWRVSNPKSSRYSLGWIPFKARSLTYRAGQVRFQGIALSLWDSYGLGDYELGAGSISEDSRGRWYLNVTVKVKKQAPSPGRTAVGIDLGLKDFFATSDGHKEGAQRFYRDLEPALAIAQRAGKKHRVKAIHAKIAYRRKDFLHKLSSKLVKEHGAIFIGNVSASKLAQTRMAKSVLDAGWSTFRTMLKYKCDDAGVWFDEVNEAYSTQTCHVCDERTGPRGLSGLGMRGWTCSACGTIHDRDVNAAKTILARGLARLAEGTPPGAEIKAEKPRIPVLQGGEWSTL